MTEMTDQRDIERVLREQRPRLVALLTLKTGSVAVAEELAQDALVALVARWPEIDNPPAWLTRVAMSKSASWWRRQHAERRARRRHGPDAVQVSAPAIADALAVHAELAKLPLRQQQVLILRWFEGMDVAETAHTLGIAEGTVRSATHRALARLRDDGQLKEGADAH